MIQKLKRHKEFLFFGIVLAAMGLMILFGSRSSLWQNPHRSEQSNFLPGRVVEVVEDRTSFNEAGARVGSQILRIQLLSGERRGDVITAQNLLFPIEHGVYAQENQRVLVFFQGGASQEADDYFSHIQSHDRSMSVFLVMGGFLGLLVLVFGKSGLRSGFGLMFTLVTIIFLLLPLIAAGFPPGLTTFLVAILIVAVSIIAIMGFNQKTWVSILGSCVGILSYVLFYFLIGAILRIDGFNVAEIDLLVVAGFYIGARELLFSSILIASLGGIMDVAVSLSSAIYELSLNDKKCSFKTLYRSGMKVSKDMIGSSANTLILAFTGTFLISLLLFAVMNTDYLVLISRVDIGIEILRGITASAAMVICAPVTAFIGARVFKRI